MKFVQTFFLAACFLSTTANTRTRFKSVKCVLVNSTVAKIRYCDLKAYTRAFVAFNFGVTHLIPLEKPIEIKGSSKYRYGLIYRDVINIDFDLCSVKDGTPNLVAKVFNAVLKDSAGEFFKKCPYPAENFDAKNVSLNDDGWPSILPTGIYVTQVTIAKAYRIELESEVWSDIKTSF